jgi:hypothetical protein
MVFAGRFAFRVGFAHSAMPRCRAPSMDAQPADRGRASGACATIDRGAVATGRDRFRETCLGLPQLKLSIRDVEHARTDAALGRGMPEWIVSAADDEQQSNRA